MTFQRQGPTDVILQEILARPVQQETDRNKRMAGKQEEPTNTQNQHKPARNEDYTWFNARPIHNALHLVWKESQWPLTFEFNCTSCHWFNDVAGGMQSPLTPAKQAAKQSRSSDNEDPAKNALRVHQVSVWMQKLHTLPGNTTVQNRSS